MTRPYKNKKTGAYQKALIITEDRYMAKRLCSDLHLFMAQEGNKIGYMSRKIRPKNRLMRAYKSLLVSIQKHSA